MKHAYMKTILFFIKNYKRHIFSVCIFSVFFALFEGLNIVVIFPIIKSVIKAENVVGQNSRILVLMNKIVGVISKDDMFMGACILVIVVVVLKNIFRYLYMVLSSFASYKIWNDFQKTLFHKYINADYRFFLDHKHGEIVYRLDHAPAAAGSILRLIPQLFTEILKTAVIIIFLFSMSFPVTLGVIAMAGVFYFFTRGISKKISYFLGKGRMEATEEQNILINEMINGIEQIKVYLAEKRWVSSVYKSIDKYFKLSRKDVLWANMPMSILEIFALTALSIFLIFMKKYSSEAMAMSLPIIGVFAYAFQRIMPSLSLIVDSRMRIMSELPVLEMLYDSINEKVSSLKDGTKGLLQFNRAIEFKNVSFSYPGRDKVLKDIAITFEKNKCTSIVGASGSGKTTIVNLLVRLYDPVEGSILIDGIDLRDYKRSSWLHNIGFVTQQTFIFHASVRDNIAFGFEEAGIDDIEKAAKRANAHEFILNLPQGYDTIVGEKGMKLSGGERQRIAIARAILRNPQVLIFDEATSALDNVSQSLIQDAIQKIAEERTVILIAHRLSTIANADKIIVIDGGVIKEQGNHQELIAKKGFYWKLYR